MSYLTTYRRPSSFSDPFFANVFGDFFDNAQSPSTRSVTKAVPRFSPKVDVLESADNYKVVVDLPGFEKNDVSIDIHDDVLTLRTKQAETQNKEPVNKEDTGDEYTVLRTERTSGYFERKFALNDTVNADAVSAKLEKGVLEVTLPKVEEASPKTRSVSVQ